jgi:soluble cytochrome b562
MKLHAILIVGLAICVSACAEKKEPAPEPAVEPQASAPAEPAPVETPAVEEESARDAEFIEHMHAHAEQLDNLNFALDDGDLPRALTAAYWLSGHQEVSGIREEWRPYLEGMREAAKSIEEAKDLDAARAAAERITEQCQGCHDAAGVKN